jgi:hypothetical protein
MKRVTFHAATSRSGNVLHIETDGCTVNIHVGLSDADGRAVTRVDVTPDNEARGGDQNGRTWDIHSEDGSGVTRVVRAPAESEA